MAEAKVKLTEVVGKAFFKVHCLIKTLAYTHFWFKGGRGSLKSSFISIEIILGMMKDPLANAVVLRKVKDTLKDSVFEQLQWAIDTLRVSEYWEVKHSPLELTYIPTGQKIIFRGADKPKKIKSIKFAKGYCKFVWFEELDEFAGMAEVRMILQSLLRGGKNFIVFYSYNPPQSVKNWVNEEALIERKDRYVHHSTYLEVDREWLGQQFIIEAEHLKTINEKAYQHEYLGEANGTGGEIFGNVKLRTITDEEIKTFDRIRRGIDWGYAVDPFHYGVMNYDKTRRKLYIFYEIHKVGLSNRKASEEIKRENKNNGIITCDSAEPKSIAEMVSYNLRVKGAKKGPDSVEYGIKFLQDLEEIIIDPFRCPNTAKEFMNYELEKDAKGNFKAEFPDKDNHCLVGDTIINTVDGDFKIKDLVGKSGRVHCFDIANQKAVISEFYDVRMTIENADIYEIELEDGRTIRATNTHPVLTKRGWVMIKDLVNEDKIIDISLNY